MNDHEDKMLDILISYPDGESRVRREMNFSREQLKEWALDNNIEQCPNCKWWVEVTELFDYSDEDKDQTEPDGHCDNCR